MRVLLEMIYAAALHVAQRCCERCVEPKLHSSLVKL